MSEGTKAILSKKLAEPPRKKSRSSFSPEMVETLCTRIGAALTLMFSAKTYVTQQSIGVEPLPDLLEALADPATGAVLSLNDVSDAGLMCLDPSLVFHAIDVMLGAKADDSAEPADRLPSALDDRLTAKIAAHLLDVFAATCNETIGEGAVHDQAIKRLSHDRTALEIARGKADFLCIRLKVVIGRGGRGGMLELHLPMTTVDLIGQEAGSGASSIPLGSGPWFDHMRDSVLDLELETVGILHTEQMSVAEISRLDIGTVLTLPRVAVENMPLLLEDGRDVIASGELGVSAGRRIVRLNKKPDEKFFAPAHMMQDISAKVA
jgi:flagellar motor switch protein FliM